MRIINDSSLTLRPSSFSPATYEGWYVTEDKGTLVGAPPNYPNYDCITWGTSANWIGINLVLSNSTGLIAYSDAHCQNIVSWIQCPLNTKGVDCNDGQFCVEQSKNGGAGSWQSVIYRVP